VKTDVAVIGGGPAGTAAALTLLRYTKHDVLVVEGTNYELPRPGETVSAAVVPLLEYLGAWQKIHNEQKLEAYSSEAAWGTQALVSRDFVFTGRGNGWHLDRRAFDAALAAHVKETGGKLLNRTWLRSVQYQQERWELELRGENGPLCVSARQVIDATGRRSTFGQRAGARRKRYDQLVGVLGYFETDDGPGVAHSVLVESVPTGWWYSAPLPGRQVVAAFMTDADQFRNDRLLQKKHFLEQLAATSYTQARIRDGRLITGPHVFPAGTQQLEPCIGPGWVAAGDAAVAFDPLSSLGIGHALASGIQAARIADERLRGSEELALAFPADVERHLSMFSMQQRKVYAMERRWPEMPFWMRRQPSSQ
jgi:flavin-dependent dehydrogenase